MLFFLCPLLQTGWPTSLWALWVGGVITCGYLLLDTQLTTMSMLLPSPSGLDGTALSFLQSKGMYWLSLNIPAYLYCRGLWWLLQSPTEHGRGVGGFGEQVSAWLCCPLLSFEGGVRMRVCSHGCDPGCEPSLCCSDPPSLPLHSCAQLCLTLCA